MKKMNFSLACLLALLGFVTCNNITSLSAKEEIGFSQNFVIDENSELNDFNSYYFLNDASSGLYGNGWYQAKTDFSDVFAFTSEGLAKKTNMTDLESGGGGTIFQNWQNWASLNTKATYTHFTCETTFKFSEAKYNAGNALFEGRAGIQLNFTEENQIPVYIGGIAFLVEPANGALVYRKDGNAEEVSDVSYYDASLYDDKEFNREDYLTLKLDVDENGIKAYINDVLRMSVVRTDLITTKIGLASTCNDVYFKNLVISPNGEETKSYNFVKNDLYDENFKAYFYQWDSKYGTNSWDQVAFDNYKLWGLTDKGISRSTAKDKLGWMTDENNNWTWLNKNNLSSLIYEKKQYKNVLIESTINFDTLASTGSAGVQFGITNTSSPVYWQEGYAAYIDSKDGSLYLRSGVNGTSTILASSSYDASKYSNNAYNKKSDCNLTIKAYGEHLEIYVDGILRINHVVNSLENHKLNSGYVGLYADNYSSYFKNISIKDLTTNGEIVDVLPTSIQINEITNPEVGKSYELSSVVTPSNASNEVIYTCDASKAFIKDNTITFIKDGTVEIEAVSVVDNDIKTSIMCNVSKYQSQFYYDLSTNDAYNLIPYYIGTNSTHALAGVNDKLENHWEVDENGINRISNDSISSVDSNYALLYLQGKYKDFELTFSFNDNNSEDGWCGLVFGKETYNSSPFSYSITNSNAIRIDERWKGYSCLGTQIGPSADEGNEYAPHPNYKKGEINYVKVRVYGTHFELYLNDMSSPVINKEVEESYEGYVGLFASLSSTSDKTTFKDVYLTTLDANGNEASYVETLELSWDNQNTNGYVNEAIKLNASANGTQKFVNYISSDPTIAYINGNYAYFLKEGKVNISATHFDNPEVITKEFTVTTRSKDGSISYDFDNGGLISYYQAGEEAASAVSEDINNHFSINNNEATRINDLGGAVSIAWAELYLDKKYSSFEITYKLKADVGIGWQGIMFGKNSYTNSFFFDGDGAYLSLNDSHATLWGQTVGNHTDAGNEALATLYDLYNYNTIRIKVYGSSGNESNRIVQIYVNDLETPVVSNYITSAPVDGYVCLFTTGSTSTIKDIYVNYLDANGNEIIYKEVESIEILNKVESINKGEQLTLNVKVSPIDSTVNEFKYISSDKSVAIINENGVVSFINGGKVTISVVSKDNESILDSMEVNVIVPLKSLEITNAITTANVNDTLKLTIRYNPSSPSNKEITFTSSDESIATIDNEGNITFLKKGKVTINVISKENENIKTSMEVEVKDNSKGCKGNASPNMLIIIGFMIIVLLKKNQIFTNKNLKI